ncbi:UNVERIFIED_CONTAM: hypothetical protein RMT77_015292 [Armadillidium vulgare]
MDFKCKIEIKEEELDLEYDSYQQDSQIFPSNEASFALAEGIKNEELDEQTLIKSELRESEKEYIFDEELVNNDVIKSENQMMIEKKFCFQNLKEFVTLKNVQSLLNKVNDGGSEAQFESDEERFFAQILMSKSPSVLLKKLTDIELKSLITNAAEEKEDSKRKSASRNISHRAVLYQQYIKKNSMENLSCGYCSFSCKSKNEFKTHLKTHSKRKYKCTHCSYECNNKSMLERHLLTHCNTKLFKCSHCSYGCNHKGNLKQHMLTHGMSNYLSVLTVPMNVITKEV